MKTKRLYLLLVLFPLVLACTKGPDGGGSVPPPPGTDQGGQSGSGDDDTPKPWDANRGKVVRPTSGNGWTVTSIDEGITYYAFEGYESVSAGHQRIFVTDIDLNNSAYSVKLGYYSSNSTASKVLKGTGAIACINGGYEKAALYLKVNGSVISSIPAETVGSTGVPQWKSEAAIYMDNERDVRIEFTGKGQSLAEWRTGYRSRATKEKYMITSAPMLLDDYEPVGEDFCALHPLASWGPDCSENPYRHQGSETNPRTALAKTEDNHVLFIVVDGRRPNTSRGISATQLTKFLVKCFNPQYAINLDGGGSSTMCVRGQGDPETFVVNYPCDNRTEPKNGAPKEADPNVGDHAGERPRDTFFYVVKK